MDSLSKSKWQLRAAVFVVFLLGAAAGALAPLAYRGWVRGNRPHRDRGGRARASLPSSAGTAATARA